jgi:predicted esterase
MWPGVKKLHYHLCLILGAAATTLLWCAALPAGAASPGEAGKLVSYQLVQNYEAGPADNPVKMYVVTYNTRGADKQMVIASGLVIIPDPPARTYSLVSFQHGTMVKREEAPSYPETCVYVPFLRQFAGQQYVISMPDYIGMGHSTVRHPFMHADSEASACLDMLRATNDLCSQLGVQLNSKLFLTGYSQGGNVTMAFHRLLERDYAAEFPITASAPGGGLYEQIQVWRYGLQHPNKIWTPVAAYMLVSYTRIYGLTKDLGEIFNKPYCDYVDGLFDGTHTLDEIGKLLPETVQEMLRPDFIKKFNRGGNSAYPAWVVNNTNNWRPRAPVRLYHARGDECCPYKVAAQTCALMRSMGANVKLIDVGNFEHVPAFIQALPEIKEWFDSFSRPRSIIGPTE